MSKILQNFTWRDENGNKLECSEKLRLLQENEAELKQMTQDIFEDGLAMGVSKENMHDAMKKLLLHLAASFSLLAFFLNNSAVAQTQATMPPIPTQQTQLPEQPSPARAQATTIPTTPDVSAAPAAPTTPSLPMRAMPETPPALLPTPLLYPANSWEGRSIGVIRILDRVTSETKELEIPVGTTITFHRLTLHLYACNQKPAGLPADTAIRLGLSEIPLKTEENGDVPLQRQFEGWFLAAEPAVNIYPSPLYNIQALRCAGAPTAPMLPPLVTEKSPPLPAQAPPTAIPDAAPLVAEPVAQPTLTPGTPPPGNLSLPTNLNASQPVADNSTDQSSKKKKKHKHHHHGQADDAENSVLAPKPTPVPIAVPPQQPGNIAT